MNSAMSDSEPITPPCAPKVSIGVPVFNNESYISEALTDLVKQDFGDLEIIISDNASTDRTGSICREFAAADSRIIYIRQSENIGVLNNFRYTLERARGEYFVWAASDDRHEHNFISELLRELEKMPDHVSAFSAFDRIDGTGTHGQKFSFDFSAPSAAGRVSKLLLAKARNKDNFIYGLHRSDALKNSKFYRWWGINAKTARRIAFPVLTFLLARGGYCHVESVLFHKRLHGDPNERHSIKVHPSLWKSLYAQYLLEVNLHVALLESFARGTKSRTKTIAIVPALAASFLRHTIWKNLNSLFAGFGRRTPRH
ncbi:MAG TPA: glycosyltransferase family 2 protein [Rhizomicrobium sp.]|jgi:glycosyltransferase involved in cell wall biosynthesis|nr:glycosyltransferase family 2 protein [Rhizomicrobium sp.]